MIDNAFFNAEVTDVIKSYQSQKPGRYCKKSQKWVRGERKNNFHLSLVIYRFITIEL